MAHDVFISYSHEDKPVADAVCAKLEQNGIRCWIANRDAIPGPDWGAQIIEGIEGSRLMVVVFSSHANASQQVKAEVDRAVNKGVTPVPFRIEDVTPGKNLEIYLSTPHWLDAITPPLENHLEHLAGTVKLLLERAGGVQEPGDRAKALADRAETGKLRSGPLRKPNKRVAYLVPSAVILAALLGAVLLRVYRNYNQSRSDAAARFLERGNTLSAKGDLDGAIAEYDQAVEMDPRNAEAYFQRCRAHEMQDHLYDAIKDCNQALAINSRYADAYLERGNARLKKGELDAAIADYGEALRINPHYAVAYYNRGLGRADKNDLDGAIADYSEALRIDPNYGDALNNRCSRRRDKGDLDAAIADCDQALRIDPRFVLPYYNLGRIYEHKGNFGAASLNYAEALKLATPNWSLRADTEARLERTKPKDAVAYYNRGLGRADKNDLDGAIGDFDEALRINPHYAEVYIDRGLARYRKGDVDGALTDYSQALRLNPRLEIAYNNRCAVRRETGDLDDALADCDQALQLAPHYSLAYYNRGLINEQKGDFSAAATDYERAADNAPPTWSLRADDEARLARMRQQLTKNPPGGAAETSLNRGSAH